MYIYVFVRTTLLDSLYNSRLCYPRSLGCGFSLTSYSVLALLEMSWSNSF